MSNTRTSWLCCTGLGLLAASGFAQDTLDCPQGELTPYVLDSGKISNTGRDSSVVFEKTITMVDAAWMRLYFADANLGPGSYVRLTSLFDGEIQELDANDLAMWNYTSAYFNGDSVHLELVAAPGTSGNRIALDQVAVHIVPGELRDRPPCEDDECGICDDDNRVPSNELWTARLMPTNCTASIYSTGSCAITAGHCVQSTNDCVLEFNVPNSFEQDCALKHPPVEDQFPVTDRLCPDGWIQFENDWAVMTIGANNQGETPYERYGVYRPIASAPASTGDSVEIWSYGKDNDNRDRNQTQQYSAGAILIREELYYRHNADIIKGSSGAALLHNDEIIGIQSSAPPCEYTCLAPATRVDHPDFVAARETLCPAGCPGDLDGDGDVDLTDLATLLTNYGMTSGATYEDGDLDADADVDLTDLAALLGVYGTTCD